VDSGLISLALTLAIVFLAARVGGYVATRAGQPAVLGELGAGLVVGNLTLAGYSGFEHLKTDASLDMVSQAGVILLLFQVGLESTVGEMARAGVSAFLVAACGIAGSFGAGWAVSRWFLPASGTYTHVYLGATLTATSVGVTARVLKQLGHARDPESYVILGAAVMDDVLGLIVLTVVAALMTASGAGVSAAPWRVLIVFLKAAAFCGGGLAIGMRVSPLLLRLVSKRAEWALVAGALAFCAVMAWLAGLFGLAPLIGAFAAGLVIEEWHYTDAAGGGERTLAALLEPVASYLVPVFFFVVGLKADLAAFAQPGVVTLASALLVAAVAGKLCCAAGLAGSRGDGLNRLAVCVGMMPRGEVELIFAKLGMTLVVAGHPLITPSLFAAIVAVVIATTVITPPALKWSLGRLSTVRRPS
jgi:Kef-type K+ transport system membrane component KefB